MLSWLESDRSLLVPGRNHSRRRPTRRPDSTTRRVLPKYDTPAAVSAVLAFDCSVQLKSILLCFFKLTSHCLIRLKEIVCLLAPYNLHPLTHRYTNFHGRWSHARPVLDPF